MGIVDSSLYRGVLIRLLHKPPTQNIKIPPYHFFTLGYFDGVVVDHKISSLKEFYFEKETQYLTSGFEEQHLCLYTKYPSDYYDKILDQKNYEYPLIVITELRLQDKSGIPFTDLQGKINEAVDTYLNEGAPPNVKIRWELFNSLGFNDFAIVFRLDRINVMRQLILKIRDIHYENKKLVYSTYSIAGFCQNYEKNKTLSEEVTASVQVSMRDSKSYELVEIEIAKEIEKEFGSKACISKHMLGKYDEEFRIETDIKNILRLFYRNGKKAIFAADSDLYTKYINFTSTKLLLDCTNDNNKGQPQDPPRSFLGNGNPNQKIESKLRLNCEKVSKIPNFPDSPAKSLRRLINSLSIASRSKLTDETSESKLFEILEMLFNLIFSDSDFPNHQTQILPKILLHKSSQNLDLISLNEAITIISNLFQTKIQASSYLFETPSFNLKFIGSLKTIQKMYSQIVESFETSLNKNPTWKTNNERINFFTTIDSSSLIRSSVLFPRATVRANEKLVPIQLDITSFYDLEFAIPYLIHEIGHHFFAKETIAKFVEVYLSTTLINFFNPEWISTNDKDIVFSNTSIQKGIKLVVSKFIDRYSKKIEKSLANQSADIFYWTNNTPDFDNFLTHSFEDLFLVDEDNNVNKIEEKYLGNIYDDCLEVFNLSLTDLEEKQTAKPIIEFLRFYRLNEKTTQNRNEFVAKLITFLMVDRCELETGRFSREEIEEYGNKSGISHAIMLMELISELLADCFMQQTLQLTAVQYEKLSKDNLMKQGHDNHGISDLLSARKAFIFNETIDEILRDKNQWLSWVSKIQNKKYLEKIQSDIKMLQNGDFENYFRYYQHYVDSNSNLSRDLEFIDSVIKRGNE